MALYGWQNNAWIKDSMIPRGAKVSKWRLDFRDHQRTRVREPFHGNRTEAKQALKDRLASVQRAKDGKVEGAYVNPRTAKKEAGKTFAEFAVEFLREYASERRSTYYADTIRGRDKKNPRELWRFFEDRRLCELAEDPSIFDEYRRHRLVQGRSAETVRKELGVLHVMFKQARRLGLVRHNPLADVDNPPRTKSDEDKGRPLSPDEITRTLAALDERDPWLSQLFLFAVGTGLRLKECVVLTWDRIDLTQRVVRVSDENKTARPRTIPLGAVAAQALEALPAIRHVSGRVFLDEQGCPLHEEKGRNRVSQRTVAAMRRAGVLSTAEGTASFKALRTTLGTVLAEKGHSLHLVGELLGHAWARQTVTAEHYVRVRVGELRPLVDAYDVWLRDGHSVDTSSQAGHSPALPTPAEPAAGV